MENTHALKNNCELLKEDLEWSDVSGPKEIKDVFGEQYEFADRLEKT